MMEQKQFRKETKPMNFPGVISPPMVEKSGKKLWAFTIFTTVIIGCIVFCAVLFLNSYNKLKLLDQYISEVPSIVEDRIDELNMRSRVFEEDIIARGKLGVKLWQAESGLSEPEMPEEIRDTVGAESGLTESEMLVKVRDTIGAESVTMTDANGTILQTTGFVTPKETFENKIRTLEPGRADSEIYTVSSEDGGEEKQNGGEEQVEGEEKQDGKAFVMFPVAESAGSRLVFEFSCEPLLEVYQKLGNWSDVLERMLSGLEAYAFIQIGGEEPIGYLYNDASKEERAALNQEAAGIIRRGGRFVRLGTKSSFGITFFRQRPALAVLQPYPEQNADVLMLVPLWDFICTSVYCAVTLSAFIMLSLLLFAFYAFKKCGENQNIEDKEAFKQETYRMTRSGRALILAAVGCFTLMLLILESNATIAYIGTTKRMELQREIKWHESQQEVIRGSYADLYLTRAEAMAKVLEEHKEYRSHDSLETFSDALSAEYLMLFDKEGNEVAASNSYTGFSVGGPESNLSEEYRAVLLGYPSAVVGPGADPYTGKQQIGAAVLLTGDDGLADGFLLAVFDAESMAAELEKESLEHTVGTFAVVNGYKAAVINNEDGIILAHTDEEMIGSDARNYITEDAFGKDYADFTDYNRESVYVSGVSSGGYSLLFMVPVRPNETVRLAAILMILAELFIIGCFYCPRACRLCAAATDEAAERREYEEYLKPGKRHALFIFANGYVVFFTVLAGITLVAAYTYAWPAFTFVWGGVWSRGVHLFSVWAALFFLSVILCTALLIRRALEEAEKRTTARLKTILKLADSFTAYAAFAVIVIGVLYLFGVNTTAVLASAGIVSIAVGMGAKDMAADILAGLFIAFEDSIHMGDVVMIDEWKGRVTNMGIRTVEITDDSGNVKILSNSRVNNVVNMSRR